MSSMNQSCWAIKNSRTLWLSACSLGNISCWGCEMRPGRNMTARSIGNLVTELKLKIPLKKRTGRCHEILLRFLCKDGEEI